MERTWKAPTPGNTYLAEIRKTVQQAVLDDLIRQAGSGENIPAVRAILTEKVVGLADWLETHGHLDAHQKMAVEDIRRWNRPEGATPPSKPAELPPGMPIGMGIEQ